MKRFGVTVFILAAVFFWFVTPAVIGRMVTPDHFVTVRTVFVEDGVEGQPIRVTPDRTVHRRFVSNRLVQLRRETDAGFALVCRRQVNDVPSEVMTPPPADMHLDRWFGIPPNMPCDVKPGRYKIVTDWEIPFWLGSRVTFSVESNVFTIYPAAGR